MTVKELYDTIGGNYENAKKIMMSDALISRFIVKLIDDPSYAKLTEARNTMNAEELFRALMDEEMFQNTIRFATAERI